MQLKLFSRLFVINKVWLVVTLTAFAILIKLAWWQWQRAEEKTLELQHLATQQQPGAFKWQDIADMPSEHIDGLKIKDNARWLAPYIWLLDNKIVNGQVGYDVVIPVRFAESGAVMLVNMGWLKAPANRNDLPQPEFIAEFEVDGLLRTRMGGFRLGQNIEASTTWPMRIQQVELAELAALLPYPLYPALVYQQHNTPFVSHYNPVVLLPEKHRGYALQWLLLGVAVIGVAIAASVKSEEKHE